MESVKKVLNKERTAFFYLVLGSIVILIFSKNWKYLRIFTMLVSIALIAYITMYDNKIKDRMITQTLNQTGISNIISTIASIQSIASRNMSKNLVVSIIIS